MKKLIKPTLTVLFILSYFGSVFTQNTHPDIKTLEIGTKAPDFNLLGVDGKTYTLKDFENSGVLVIIFSCNHCPTAQAYENRIIAISADYKQKGVAVVVISSTSPSALNLSEEDYSDMGDTYDEMKVRAKTKAYNFPYLYDGDDQKCALAYGPAATPHCFVFDKDRKLKYVGRIDANEKPGTGNGEDLRNAIDAVLIGKPVTNQVTKVFGCSIKWSWKSEYTQQLYKKWAQLPVTLNEIDVNGVKELVKNDSTGKLRLINIWATWCGPCANEFPDLVIIDRMYRKRSFEFITISADKPDKRSDVLKFLQNEEASNKNFIFNKNDVYELIEAVDPNWQGALPYTMIIEPGGKIIYRNQGMIDPLELKKTIVENKYMGRYYNK